MFNKLIANLLPYMPKKLIWVFSSRYIAGETIESALNACIDLNKKNIDVTVDLLGEFISTLSQAEENKNQYLTIIDRFTEMGISGNFSLKPTMFGLLIDKDICFIYIREIVKKAAGKNSFIRIDMEDSRCVDMEIELYRKLRLEFPMNVGLVLQAYLRRTMCDLETMCDTNTPEKPLNFRLCKGIYIEPVNIAFKEYQEIREKYVEALDFMLKNNIYAGIATHDKFLVDAALKLIEKYNVHGDRYEFQMLYGVTPELRDSIVEKGHRMRVYVPFGKEWFAYSTRRLKENPKIAAHIIKALFYRG